MDDSFQKNTFGRARPMVALFLIVVSIPLRFWFAYPYLLPLAFSGLGLLMDGWILFLLMRSTPAAYAWMAARAGFAFLFGFAWLLLSGNVAGSLFEVGFAITLLALSLGVPSLRRIYGAATLYALWVVGLFVLLAIHPKPSQVGDSLALQGSPQSQQILSTHQYSLSLSGLPWRSVEPEKIQEELGFHVKGVDLSLIRTDGKAVGLFFPLHFSNQTLTPTLAKRLEESLRSTWFQSAHSWERYSLPDGFLIDIEAELSNEQVTYVICYRHFGNLGVYGVFWSRATEGKSLLAQVEEIYHHLSASPIKDRLPRFTPKEVYQTNANAVVQINAYNEEKKLIQKGSGFNISPNGLILTALHLLLPADSLEVVFPNDQKTQEVEVMALSDPQRDLALLTIPGNSLPYVTTFKSVPATTGDTVYVIGNPKGLVNSLSEGIIGAVRRDGDVTLYQITAPISSGSSGGPVFNTYGEVIGIATALVVEAQNLNFSVSIDEIEKLYFLDHPMTIAELLSPSLQQRKEESTSKIPDPSDEEDQEEDEEGSE